MQVDIRTDGGRGLRVCASATSDGRSSPYRSLDAPTLAELTRFHRSVAILARSMRGLSSTHLTWARRLYTSVFSGETGHLLDQMRGASSDGLLLRISCPDPVLRHFPWEVMRGPGDMDPSLAAHASLRMVRVVYSSQRTVPREVRGAARILTIAPEGMTQAAADLRRSLSPLIQAGALEWLEPCVGPDARWRELHQRLERSPRPHIIHFITHGRVLDGAPQLLLDPHQDHWISAEVLSTALASTVASDLRLVYLETCQGAQPGQLASAAEILAARGASGVVAHLWEVQSATARETSHSFYRALTGQHAGDVSAAINTARLQLLGAGTAEFLCPVLYLRSEDPVLFDFSRRRSTHQVQFLANKGANTTGDALSPRQQTRLTGLEKVLAGSSSLFVGEFVDPDGSLGTRQVRHEFSSLMGKGRHDSLYALMQRYELAKEREELKAVFEEALGGFTRDGLARCVVLDAMASLCGPGLFITLLWLPLLEEALAFHHPDAEILVLQPLKPGSLDGMRLFHRYPSSNDWIRQRRIPPRLDLRKQFVVLRLYGGYTALSRSILGDPVLTDDDQLSQLAIIDTLPEQILAFLRHHPMAIFGFSPLRWAHRELLRRLTDDQPLAAGSLAALGPNADDSERHYWESSRGPAGRQGLTTIGFEDLQAIAAAIAAAE